MPRWVAKWWSRGSTETRAVVGETPALRRVSSRSATEPRALPPCARSGSTLTAETHTNSLGPVTEAARARFLVLVVLVALLGVADGVFLSMIHIDYEVGGTGLATTCKTFSATGCSITAGRFGDIYGVPVATIGAAGALATAVVAGVAWTRRDRYEDPFRQALWALAATSLAASLVMATISLSEGSWCPFCVAWYAINGALAWLAWKIRDPHTGWGDTIDDTLGAPAIVAVLVFAAAIVPTMSWYGQRKAALQAERDDEIVPQLVAELKKTPPRALSLPDAPKKGPDDAEVVLIEFGDFECSHCARLFETLGEYTASTDRSVQVIFAHYPIGSACNPDVQDLHKHACAAATAAECASTQGKFWEYAALLFANQGDLDDDDLRDYATQVGLDVAAYETCLRDPATAARIAQDIALGGEIEITGTPTFFINGYRAPGGLPASALAKVIDGLVGDAPAP